MISAIACIDCGKLKKTPDGKRCQPCSRRYTLKMQNKNWTIKEIMTLNMMYSHRKAVHDLKAKLLLRHTSAAITERAKRLGIQPKRKSTLKTSVNVELRV